MRLKFFSIIVVALNPGEGLKTTLDSIAGQTFTDYEVIVKDGGSRDGSLENLEAAGYFSAHPRIRVVRQPDTGIYDGMNQALKLSEGHFLYFLNCGDLLYDENVLKNTAEIISGRDNTQPAIYYGNQYNRREDSLVYSAPEINDFACYRNVPCHQVCFYDRKLFQERAYDLSFLVRADYEHFLYCIYERQAKGICMPVTVASYEGGGFSETAENRRQSAREHRVITTKYLGLAKVKKYRLIMWVTLAPLRTKISESRALSGIYNGIKRWVYQIRQRS